MKRVPEIWEYEPPNEVGSSDSPSKIVAVPELCGRSAQTSQITECLDSIGQSPKIREILLSGASGTGKTALTQWACAEASNRGFQIAQATCEPFHAGISFFPVRKSSDSSVEVFQCRSSLDEPSASTLMKRNWRPVLTQ